MANPIGANAVSSSYVPAAADLARPQSIPEPAIQVTASDKASSSSDASMASRQQPQNQTKGDNDPLDKALEQVNDSMKAWATGMRFDIDPEAERVVVSIIDSATGEVLRTVPSEAVIRVAKMIVQLQGKSVDTKA